MNKKPSRTEETESGSIAAVIHLSDWISASRPLRTHREQLVGADVLPFPRKRPDQRRPRSRGNAPALTPLGDRPMTFPNSGSHFGDRIPAAEYVVQSLHAPNLARDELSRQVGTMFHARKMTVPPDNLPMGRARSPRQFNKELAVRLKAARIAAGYDSAPKFAQALGVQYETYKKWEGGRTPIPHAHLPRACQLTGKDPNYFYGVYSDTEQRRTA